MSKKASSRVEIRHGGTEGETGDYIDEILVYNGNRNVLFHLEMMSSKDVWMRIYNGYEEIDINISSRGKLNVKAEKT